MLYNWPGNIRELENVIEHAFVLCQGDLIGVQHLPDRLLPESIIKEMPLGMTLKDIERHAIFQALKRNNWMRMATARELGIDKNTLRRKIQRLGIPREPN
jgi:transcriptional regulator of acetoin/glycerol metabolism